MLPVFCFCNLYIQRSGYEGWQSLSDRRDYTDGPCTGRKPQIDVLAETVQHREQSDNLSPFLQNASHHLCYRNKQVIVIQANYKKHFTTRELNENCRSNFGTCTLKK